MPKILKTKGICLTTRALRESSKLATFYTEQFGKLAFLGKGARNPKSKFGSTLEIFALSELIFYRTELRPVYILSDATLVDAFTNLQLPDRFFYANQIVELILRATAFEDPNHRLFSLAYSALRNLNHTVSKKPVNYSSLLGAYFLKAISILGFKPELRHCVLCKNPKIAYFSIERGGVVCASAKHPKPNNIINAEYSKMIKYLLFIPLSKTLGFSIPKFTQKLIQDYLTYHLEKIELHSLQFNPDISKVIERKSS